MPDNDVRFSIEGFGGSRLIIDIFAPELNGSVIYCRERLMGELIANFTLRSTRMYVYIAHCILLGHVGIQSEETIGLVRLVKGYS